MIIVKEYNEVYDYLECDDSVAGDLNDYFSFEVENHHFMNRRRDPTTGKWVKFRRGWDGRIRLFKKNSRKLYKGLRMRLVEFCAERELKLVFENTEEKPTMRQIMTEAADIIKQLNLPVKPYDFQYKALLSCLFHQRRIILSPTGSGKSLIIYMILVCLLQKYSGKKYLIIVPTLNLIHQMYNDFQTYGIDFTAFVHLIYEGQEKLSEKPIYLSTWQSIDDMPREYFKQFEGVICDEVHGATAKSIKYIMECLTDAPVRIGLSGTLKDLPVHRLTLEGLFGSIEQVAKTVELVEQKVLSKPLIKSFTFKYPEKVCKAMRRQDYASEMDFLCNHSKRNDFITRLAFKCHMEKSGPTLVLFRHIEHGKLLAEKIKLIVRDPTLEWIRCRVDLIYGKTPGEEREEIRKILDRGEEKDKFQYANNGILVASYGTFSTGANIPRLRHIIFAAPYKSKIKVLQSIGRGLRITEDKKECTIYDIADDMSYGEHQNHTLKHMVSRIEIYAEEGFDYRLYNMEMPDL